MTRQNQSGVSCVVCNKQKAPGSIHKGQSKLLPQADNFFICNTCADAKKEPRAFIIIVARTQGFASVADYIKHHRYEGETISAKEIMV